MELALVNGSMGCEQLMGARGPGLLLSVPSPSCWLGDDKNQSSASDLEDRGEQADPWGRSAHVWTTVRNNVLLHRPVYSGVFIKAS